MMKLIKNINEREIYILNGHYVKMRLLYSFSLTAVSRPVSPKALYLQTNSQGLAGPVGAVTVISAVRFLLAGGSVSKHANRCAVLAVFFRLGEGNYYLKLLYFN
jgi:hypothetical protein